jgi:hypothetical protein
LENFEMANEQIKSLLFAGYFGAAIFELEEAGMPCPILSTGEEPWLLFRFESAAQRAQFLNMVGAADYPSGATWQLGPNGDVSIPAEDMPALFEALVVCRVVKMREQHRKLLATMEERVRQAGLRSIGERP